MGIFFKELPLSDKISRSQFVEKDNSNKDYIKRAISYCYLLYLPIGVYLYFSFYGIKQFRHINT
jgi:hypothetical protein